MKKRHLIMRGLAGIMAFVMFISITASTITFGFSGAINKALNINTSKIITADEDAAVDTNYYSSEFGTDYQNKQSALKVQMAVAAENVTQAEEGSVLLKNKDALPLAIESKVTLFGNGSFHSNINPSPENTIPTMTFVTAMQKVFGESNVNSVLAQKVYSSMEPTSAQKVVEAPIADVKAQEQTWTNDYNDAAIAVFTRVGGESNDTPTLNEDGSHFLGLQANEKALMEYLKEEKSKGVFKKIIVVINADQMMELGWLDNYDVDGCILAGIPGPTGFEGVANVLAGNASPSGHLVDTYATNSLSSPASVYANDHVMQWTNKDEVNAYCRDNNNNGDQIDNYTIYAEGIYVGYKYYETRYADCVAGNGNADNSAGSSQDGNWNYKNEVAFPFGYGLSYTTFDQELSDVSCNAATDKYELKVKVTNTGKVAGKSVVQVYAQTPYDDYEKENGIEKSAVQLVGFGKTDMINPGESTTITVEAERYMLASYDEKATKGYIMSAGDYYLAIGDSSHDALNNILAAKGYSTKNGMDADGNKKKTYTWNQKSMDSKSYEKSRFADYKVTNQFDNADLNHYGVDFKYLSRSDWAGTFPVNQVKLAATKKMMNDINSGWYKKPSDAPSVSDFTQGANNGLKFADMRTVDWNDDKTWNKFLDQLNVDQMAGLMQDTFGVGGIDSIGMPAQKRSDDGNGIGSAMTATGTKCMPWVSNVMTARTWSNDRFDQKGKLMAVQAAYSGLNEVWYGGGNIHRTPFCGRNNVYYTEDGNYNYLINAAIAKSMQDNGINYCIKHFVLNDQETGRESLNTFANEQTIREEYLRGFEGAFCEGGALSVMTAFNRLGCVYAATSVPLITNVLCGEWAYKGHITTDGFSTSSLYKTHYQEMFTAGIDFFCLDPGETPAAMKAAINSNDGYMLERLRDMTKRNVYAASHTVSMNGLSSNSIVATIVPWWQILILAVTAVSAIGFLICLILSAVGIYGRKKER
jgi:Beta-glucosidase-related glycosidases